MALVCVSAVLLFVFLRKPPSPSSSPTGGNYHRPLDRHSRRRRKKRPIPSSSPAGGDPEWRRKPPLRTGTSAYINGKSQAPPPHRHFRWQAKITSGERIVRRIHPAPPPLNTIGPPSLTISGASRIIPISATRRSTCPCELNLRNTPIINQPECQMLWTCTATCLWAAAVAGGSKIVRA